MKCFKYLIPVIVLTVVITEQTQAIPAFARKYQISCQTCHVPAAPKLKAYGDDFAGDGFRLQDYQAPRYFVETGDQKLSLIRDFPIAVRMDGHVKYNFSGNEKSDFSAPYLIKFLSGGELSDRLSYYFYFYMDERREVAGVEDAYLMYNNMFNTDFDIYLGQFQVSDPLFKRELRMTLEDYHLYTAPIGMSQISLKYDKGVMLTYGLPTSTDVIVEVLNGNGLVEADRFHVFDKDKHKSFVGRISQDIGGFLRLGVFGYYGKEDMTNTENNTITNEASFVGPDATISISDKVEINFQYLLRTDSEIYPNHASVGTLEEVKTDGMLGEVVISPQGDQSNWYAVAMYNYVNSDYDIADYQSATLHLGYLIRRNIRLVGEYNHVIDDYYNDDDYGQVSFGFVSAF
jgi:hypothetical protein